MQRINYSKRRNESNKSHGKKKVLLLLYLVVMNVGKQLADSQFCFPNTQCLITELDRALFGKARSAS